MRVEVTLWILANFISLLVSSKELWKTTSVWNWTRENLDNTTTMHKIALRNFRTAFLKFLLALSFVLAGLTVLVAGTGTLRVWLLVLGAVLISVDIAWESKYRGNMFEVARRRAEESRNSTASSEDE